MAVTLMPLMQRRHTDALIRALSGHKTAAMISVYAKKTKDQRLAGARKRLRLGEDERSEFVGMGL